MYRVWLGAGELLGMAGSDCGLLSPSTLRAFLGGGRTATSAGGLLCCGSIICDDDGYELGKVEEVKFLLPMGNSSVNLAELGVSIQSFVLFNIFI